MAETYGEPTGTAETYGEPTGSSGEPTGNLRGTYGELRGAPSGARFAGFCVFFAFDVFC